MFDLRYLLNILKKTKTWTNWRVVAISRPSGRECVPLLLNILSQSQLKKWFEKFRCRAFRIPFQMSFVQVLAKLWDAKVGTNFFPLDGRRFSVIWFSESIRNWRVIFLLYGAGGTDFCCEVLNKCREIRTYASRIRGFRNFRSCHRRLYEISLWAERKIRNLQISDPSRIRNIWFSLRKYAGTKVVARSKLTPLSDQISDQIPVPPTT